MGTRGAGRGTRRGADAPAGGRHHFEDATQGACCSVRACMHPALLGRPGVRGACTFVCAISWHARTLEHPTRVRTHTHTAQCAAFHFNARAFACPPNTKVYRRVSSPLPGAAVDVLMKWGVKECDLPEDITSAVKEVCSGRRFIQALCVLIGALSV